MMMMMMIMSLVSTVLSVEFRRLLRSSCKITRDLTKLQSVLAAAKFYLSGTSTNISRFVEVKSMGHFSVISVVKPSRLKMK